MLPSDDLDQLQHGHYRGIPCMPFRLVFFGCFFANRVSLLHLSQSERDVPPRAGLPVNASARF